LIINVEFQKPLLYMAPLQKHSHAFILGT